AAAEALEAGVLDRAAVAVVAARADERRRIAGTQALQAHVAPGAGIGVVACHAVGENVAAADLRLAHVVGGARVAIVTGGAAGLRIAATDAARTHVVGGARIAVVTRGVLQELRVTDAATRLAMVAPGAEVAIVTGRSVEDVGDAHAL